MQHNATLKRNVHVNDAALCCVVLRSVLRCVALCCVVLRSVLHCVASTVPNVALCCVVLRLVGLLLVLISEVSAYYLFLLLISEVSSQYLPLPPYL